MRDIFTPYLARGWSCFPVQHAGKRPMFSWERYQSAPPSDVEIASWCEEYNRANVAIATGEVSGLVVIDVDSAAGLEALAKFGRLPETPCVKTGHGWHYYFKHPGFKQGNKAGMIEGVDVRGDGGYVIAPPSVHETGVVYEWAVTPDAAPLADLPEWLIRLMRPPVAPPPGPAAQPGRRERDDGSKWLEDALGKASQGTRDEWAFWLACQLRDNGLSYSEAENVLRAYAARVMQGTDPYTEREALTKVRSAFNKPARDPAVSQTRRAEPRTTFYPEEQWHEGPLPEIEEGQEPGVLSRPSQHAGGEKLWVDTNEVFARVFAEVLEEPETLSEYPPFLMPFNILHQFGGFAHYAWRGKLMHVLGGPGFGKTSFGETMAETLLKWGLDWVWYGPEWSPLEMGYRAVHRNGGMSLDNVASYQVYRHDELRGVAPEQRGGLPMGAAVQSASINALDAMMLWPGRGYFIPQAALTLDELLVRVKSAVMFARDRGRNPVAWFIDYLQIMRRLGAASDAMWGERLLGMIKDFCIDMSLLGVVFLQPRKEDTDRVRSAGMDAIDMNTDNSWLLDQNSAQGISDQQCNLYVTLNPRYDANGRATGDVKIAVVKNSLGRLGSVWAKADLAKLRYLDSQISTAPKVID